MKANAGNAFGPAGRLSRRGLEIFAAVLLLLYIVTVVVSFVAKSSATQDVLYRVPIVDQSEDPLFFTSYAGRNWLFMQYGAILAGSVLIVTAAAIVYRVLSAYEPSLALIGSFMLLGAALFAGLFAVAGLILVEGHIGPLVVQDGMKEIRGFRKMNEVFVPILVLSEKIWLTFAALGALAYGALIAWTRALPRPLGWLGIASALLLLLIWIESIELMQMNGGRPSLVWIPTRSLVSLWGGSAYLVWLLLSAVWLLIKGTGTSTTEMSDSQQEKTDA